MPLSENMVSRISRTIRRLKLVPAEALLQKVICKLFRTIGPMRTPYLASNNGSRIRIHHRKIAADMFSAWQCFYRKQYAIPEPTFHRPIHKELLEQRYRHILGAAKIPLIIDCGANIGASSLWLSAQYPKSQLIAIEPNPLNFQILYKNLQHDKENTNGRLFTIVEGGIGERDGEMSLVDTGNGEMGFRTQDQEGGKRVTIFSLDTILSTFAEPQAEPFILKVDIEGSEKSLFGRSSWSHLDRFPLIILEEHDFMMPGKSTASEFFKFHSDRQRDFLFGEENIFSFDYASLEPAKSASRPDMAYQESATARRL